MPDGDFGEDSGQAVEFVKGVNFICFWVLSGMDEWCLVDSG